MSHKSTLGSVFDNYVVIFENSQGELMDQMKWNLSALIHVVKIEIFGHLPKHCTAKS